MKLNFIKVALRNMLKDKVYTFINIFGLTLSLSFSFLLYLFVAHQLSHDQKIDQRENVYRLAADFTLDGHKDIYANAPRPLGAALVTEYPGIEASVKILGYNSLQVHEGLLWKEDQYITTRDAFIVDSSFFKVFRMPLLEGNPQTALKEPNSVVISTSVAQSLFGKQSALGRIVRLEEGKEAVVTGIFKDLDDSYYMPFKVLISYETYFNPEQDDAWYGAHVYTYVRTTSEFIPADVKEHWKPFFEKYMKETFDYLNGTAEIIFQPVDGLYLAPEYIWEPYPHGSQQNVNVFMLVAVFLLVVACFNYTNLSLSKSLTRGKEVGVRKALGASKNGLRLQFLLESILIALISSLLSISFIIALLPTFNQLVGQQLTINFINEPINLLILFGIGAIVGVISGLYPAFHTSSIESAQVLKGRVPTKSSGNLSLRKGLVLTQQVISLVLIICTLVVIDQVNFVRNMNTGFDKKNLALFDLRDENIRAQIEPFKQELLQLPGVENVTRMNDTPINGLNEFSFMVQKPNGKFESLPTQVLEVSDDYLETLGIELVAGRDFVQADSNYKSVLVNEYQVQYLGYTPDKIIGTRFKFPEDDEIRTIVGVVKNFTMGSASDPLKSMTISYSHGGRRFMGVRIAAENQVNTLAQIEGVWQDYGAEYPFTYTFMDEQLDLLLGKEDKLYKLLIFGSVLIILISCLGLFGLISFTALQRTKEIGIRKVLGANELKLYYVLMEDFIKLLGIAIFIAAGLSIYLGSNWLENFAFRTQFDWVNILVAALVSIFITVFTLSYHAQKVISTNPVESLKE